MSSSPISEWDPEDIEDVDLQAEYDAARKLYAERGWPWSDDEWFGTTPPEVRALVRTDR